MKKRNRFISITKKLAIGIILFNLVTTEAPLSYPVTSFAAETQDDNVPTGLSIMKSSDNTVYAKWINEKTPKSHYLRVYRKTDDGYKEESSLLSVNKGRKKYDITKYVRSQGTYYFELTVKDTGMSVFSPDYTVTKDAAKEIRKSYSKTKIAAAGEASDGGTLKVINFHITPGTATDDDKKEITKETAERTKGPGVITPVCTWTKSDKGWQYFKENGQMAVGEWKYIHKIWYRFDDNGVIMRNTWIKETDGYYYYLNERGALVTDGKTPDGKTVDKLGRWTGI